MHTHEVAVVVHDTEETVKTLKASSRRDAEKIERGMAINLDHRFYYTEIRSVGPLEAKGLAVTNGDRGAQGEN